eukprot:EG_transcript_8922
MPVDPQPWLGFTVKEAPRLHRLVIHSVAPGGPGQGCGLRCGDVVLAVDGQSVRDQRSFTRLAAKWYVGQAVGLEVARLAPGEECLCQCHCPLLVGTRRTAAPVPLPSLDDVRALRETLSDATSLRAANAAIFRFCDRDGSGLVDPDEFQCMMQEWVGRQLEGSLSEAAITGIFARCDFNGSRRLSALELLPFTQALLRVALQALLPKPKPAPQPAPQPEPKDEDEWHDMPDLPSIPLEPPPTLSPWLGLTVRKDRDRGRLLVDTVAPGGPAAHAGVRVGDQLQGVARQPVHSTKALCELTATWLVGQTVAVVVVRPAEGRLTLPLTVGSRPARPTPHPPSPSVPSSTAAPPPPLLCPTPLDSQQRSTGRPSSSSHGEAAAMFQALGGDGAAMVVRRDLAQLQPWLQAHYGRTLPLPHLERLFDAHDPGQSGFLTRAEFPPLASAIREAATP